MATVVTNAADELHARLAEIRGSVDAISQIIDRSLSLQSQDAQQQLELANNGLVQAQAALLRLAGSGPDVDQAETLDWEFHISQPPNCRRGSISVALTPVRVRTVPPVLDPLTD